jgi:hypothetical protein
LARVTLSELAGVSRTDLSVANGLLSLVAIISLFFLIVTLATWSHRSSWTILLQSLALSIWSIPLIIHRMRTGPRAARALAALNAGGTPRIIGNTLEVSSANGPRRVPLSRRLAKKLIDDTLPSARLLPIVFVD